MAANLENMFYVREKPWHGLGIMVAEAPNSATALRLAGLDWNVIQKDIMMVGGSTAIPGFEANVRDTDGSILWILTDRYRVVQNTEAFSFTDTLLGEGVCYETAGSCIHTGDISGKLDEARDTLLYVGQYIAEFISALFPNADGGSARQRRNIQKMREDMKAKYYDVPDLADVGKNGYCFINAISDFATHSKPLRERTNYCESLFAKTVDGNP